MTEQKTELTDAEIEELISSDPTPVDYSQPKRKGYTKVQRREYQRDYRARKAEETKAQEPVTARRQELLALFESSPCQRATDLETMVASARLFAQLLHIKDVQAGETLRTFGSRVFHAWSTGVTVNGGILAPRIYRFPLVDIGTETGDGTQASFALFNWLPDSKGKIFSEEPQLPEFPQGSDAPLHLKHLPELLGEENCRAARLQMQMETAAKAEEPRLIQWIRNPITNTIEPRTVFVRPSRAYELQHYRLGYRWSVGPEHPLLRLCPEMGPMAIRATNADLVSMAEQDYKAALDEIRGANTPAVKQEVKSDAI